MIFNQGRTGRTVVILFSFGIAYVFMLYSFGRDDGAAISSLPPIKTSGGRNISRRDSEENGSLKSIIFLTDICFFNVLCAHIFKSFI